MFNAASVISFLFASQGVETRFVGFSGTGLLSGQGWWNREITAQVSAWHPDVVVIEACCNYANGEPEYVTVDGQAIQADTQAMYDAWAAQAADAMRRATASGARLLWVTTPDASTANPPSFRLRIRRFNQSIDGLGIERINWKQVLEPDGTYTRTVMVGGQRTIVRQADGVHLTPAGNLLVAEVTWLSVAGSFTTRGATAPRHAVRRARLE